MNEAGFTNKTFRFLKDLERNNNKTWFHSHKSTFVEHLQEPFEALFADVSQRLESTDTPFEGSRRTMFRMNRDVRFSEDKSPYKTSLSGLLTRSGLKKQTEALMYVQLDAQGGFAAAGYYRLSPKELLPLRREMTERPDGFLDAVASLATKGLHLEEGGSLKRLPKGFSGYEGHGLEPFLKRKSFIVRDGLDQRQ
ncbi:MAG: DUF2461 domain-containing protein, partial [Myxococcota bacterium]